MCIIYIYNIQLPRYNRNIVESGVKHQNPAIIRLISTFYVIKLLNNNKKKHGFLPKFQMGIILFIKTWRCLWNASMECFTLSQFIYVLLKNNAFALTDNKV